MRKFQWSKHQWPDCMRLCRLVDKSLIVCWVITFRLSCHDFDFLWASQETAGPHETSALTTTVPFVGSQQRRLWAHESSFWWRKAESLHHHNDLTISLWHTIHVTSISVTIMCLLFFEMNLFLQTCFAEPWLKTVPYSWGLLDWSATQWWPQLKSESSVVWLKFYSSPK